jgi:hypothetical protein
VFKVDSIARDFNLILLLAQCSGDAPGDCTYWRVLPSLVALNNIPPRVLHPSGRGHDGVADSLSTLLYNGNFNNKGSRDILY